MVQAALRFLFCFNTGFIIFAPDLDIFLYDKAVRRSGDARIERTSDPLGRAI